MAACYLHILDLSKLQTTAGRKHMLSRDQIPMRLHARFVRLPQRFLLRLAWRRRDPQVHQCASAASRERPRRALVRVNPTVPTDETRGAFHPDAAFVLERTTRQRNSPG